MDDLQTGLACKNEIVVGASSVINLKAELLQRTMRAKQANPQVVTSTLRLKGSRAAKVAKTAPIVETEHNKLEESWIALQRKTKVYDELQERGGLDDSDDEQDTDKPGCLVNFLEKTPTLGQTIDGWVEVTDEFGRNRLVKKDADLPAISGFVKAGGVDSDLQSNQLGLVSDSMRMHQERLEWDAAIGSKASNLHYDGKKERRTLGTGFYQFSQDLDIRQTQMAELTDMREDTILKRTKAQIVAQKRSEKINDRRQLLEERAARKRAKMATEKVEASVDVLLQSFKK